MTMLFSPYSIGDLKLSNRIVIPPMCQYSATTDGMPTDWHLMHYGSLAFSGASLLIVEATAVELDGRISGNDLALCSDETEAALGSVIQRIRNHSPIHFGVQLAHAGRKASRTSFDEKNTLLPKDGGWEVHAPSALPYDASYTTPRALDETGIERIVAAFVKAAERADRIGFEFIEIHAAHGYLLHEFLSPLTNQRTDSYGGSLENRMRLTLETFEGVRAVFPAHKPVGVRISGSDWVDGGWDIEQSITLTKELEKRNCSYMHVSGGGLSPLQKLNITPGYQVSLASRVKQATRMPVIAVGLITDPEQAETILQSNDADLVAIGRSILFNPHWPWHAAAKLGASIAAPLAYHRARPHLSPDLFTK